MKVVKLVIIKSFLMNSINFESLIITIFVLVDDWYQTEGKALKGVSPGTKPYAKRYPLGEMSDSEIMTLALVMDYLPFPGETHDGSGTSRNKFGVSSRQFIGFIRANYGSWFPQLLEQSQFNRRLRKLGQMLEILRRKWVRQLGVEGVSSLVIDTKPIPVMGYRRSKKRSDFYGSADYGYCAARKMKYFGYKLVMLSTLEGIPIAYDLVSANTDERKSVEGVLELVQGCDIYADKGFIGQDWQEEIISSTGNRILTIQRCNQHHQNSNRLKRLIGRVRQRIEGVFHEIQQLDWSWRGNPADPLVQNTGRNPERFLNKTVAGFVTHMAAKITSHTLRLLLRRQFGIDVQTFQSVAVC